MAGECCLDGGGCGFDIADFADHDDIGVLAEERFERFGEGHPDFFVHLCLCDTIEVVFDGVFDGGDVFGCFVHLAEGGVERCGFARASWSCDEDDAVGLGDLCFPDGFGVFVES